MKNLLLIIFVLYFTIDARAQWEEIYPPEVEGSTSVVCNFVQFLDADNGFLVVRALKNKRDQLFLFKTTDRGSSWQLIRDLPEGLVGIHFFDQYRLVLSVAETTKGFSIYSSSDGGKTIALLNGELPFAGNFHFFDSARGILQQDGVEMLLITDNGGISWKPVLKNKVIKNVHFVNGYTAFSMQTINGEIKFSESFNGGNTWNSMDIHVKGTVMLPSSFIMVSEDIGYASGLDGILKTTDGGHNWNLISTNVKQANYICFTDVENGYAYAYSSVYKTSDGGVTWVEQHQFKDSRVDGNGAMVFLNEDIGYIYNPTRRTFGLTVNGGQKKNEPIKSIDHFNITVYPNPAVNNINVVYKGRESEHLNLDLHDITGRLVWEGEMGCIDSDCQMYINTEQLKKGVYFLAIKRSDGSRISRKVLLH